MKWQIVHQNNFIHVLIYGNSTIVQRLVLTVFICSTILYFHICTTSGLEIIFSMTQAKIYQIQIICFLGIEKTNTTKQQENILLCHNFVNKNVLNCIIIQLFMSTQCYKVIPIKVYGLWRGYFNNDHKRVPIWSCINKIQPNPGMAIPVAKQTWEGVRYLLKRRNDILHLRCDGPILLKTKLCCFGWQLLFSLIHKDANKHHK